ncbi:MAG: dTDP-4-dehydrorhamnose reductase [Bacteroidetes bacterium]|nr:MAG: dTDP-4-dehydrorhamnose reductase [Bacteroidota bacterium]
MKVLLTGCNGLVGQKLAELFIQCNTFELIMTSRNEQSPFEDEKLMYRQLDITNKKMVRTVLDEIEPEVIINAAAIADVDACERDRASAWQTNAAGVENLAHSAKIVGASIVQISTDYIFDGKSGPYEEEDRANPINYYGKTKLAAENILRTSGISYTILRTSFLYGAGFETKSNFPLRVIEALDAGEQVKAPDDQFSNPTLANDVAYGALRILETKKSGIYNIAGPTWLNRYEFAQLIATEFGYDKKKIVPVKMSSHKLLAPRPLKSGFVTLKATVDLGLTTTSIEQGLMMLKSQIKEFRTSTEETKNKTK